MSASDDLLTRLRTLALERPRDARALAGQLLDERPPELATLLDRIGLPGESRLRQVFANVVRADPRRAAALPQLATWLPAETDEFTRKALQGAIEVSGPVQSRSAPAKDAPPVDRRFVEAYREAADRLTHRVRNALLDAQGAMIALNRAVTATTDEAHKANLSRIAAELFNGFRTVARVVEFETDDGFFAIRPVHILEWLRSMTADYAREAAPVELAIEDATSGIVVRVRGSDYLLGLIFWNLWKNAQQMVSGPCRITVRATLEQSTVHLLVIDNGEGFSADARGVAFVDKYSTKGRGRGRGLLEVQDATERLHGSVRLVDHAGTYRVRISLPLEAA